MILSKGGSPDLYVANIDGTGLKQLTFTREAGRLLAGRPTIKRFVTSPASAGRFSLPRLRFRWDGGAHPTPGAPSPTEPDWSPDGKWIAFTSLTGGFQIFILRLSDGSVMARLRRGRPVLGTEFPRADLLHRCGPFQDFVFA
jgi:Tol biopolymer transport system component